MSGESPWAGFTWLHEPVSWGTNSTGELHWTTRPTSDFWRYTGGVVGADDGDALLARHDGDFRVTVRLVAELDDLYDQCGLMMRADERNWVKIGIELDGGTWFSVVETREQSDWSKQATPDGTVEFTVWREGDTVRVGLTHSESVPVVRELTFDGPVLVGPYSCAPKGAGFPLIADMQDGPDGEWLLAVRAGRAVSRD